MYSNEFMKFLYGYQKDEFKPKDTEPQKIHFKNNGTGKLAEVTIAVKK